MSQFLLFLKKISYYKYLYLLLVTLLTIVLFVLLVAVFYVHNKDQAPQHKNIALVNKVVSLQKNNTVCTDVINQLKPDENSILNTNEYDNQTKEKALNYLMICYFETNNTKQALNYANDLENLYTQDGSSSTAQLHQLQGFITYMKTYTE